MVVRSATKVTTEVLDLASRLKLVIRAGVGLDNIDLKAAKQRKITVSNTPEATSVSVAELVIGLMLSLVRHIVPAHQSVQQGRWERKKFAGTELYGKSLAIAGFGRIGREVARRARAFGMKLRAFDVAPDQNVARELGVEYAPDLNSLFRNADFISLHLPITDQTRRIINEASISQMKTGVFLINTARGALLDDNAVATAIRSNKLGGAAIDVYDTEPPAEEHPLLNIPQVLTIPHLGASTAEGQRRAGMEVAAIVRQFAAQGHNQ